jgi:hypothetical protein
VASLQYEFLCDESDVLIGERPYRRGDICTAVEDLVEDLQAQHACRPSSGVRQVFLPSPCRYLDCFPRLRCYLVSEECWLSPDSRGWTRPMLTMPVACEKCADTLRFPPEMFAVGVSIWGLANMEVVFGYVGRIGRGKINHVS